MCLPSRLRAMPLVVGAIVGLQAVPCTAGPFIDINSSGDFAVVSDYRFRGISQSDRAPALQGGLELEEVTGVLAGAWVSTIAPYRGSRTEIDLYGGVHHQLDGFDIRLMGYAYIYPGGRKANSHEGTLIVTHAVGTGWLNGQLSIAPWQQNARFTNSYMAANLTLPLRKSLAIEMHFGQEHGSHRDKLDWKLGVAYTLGRVTASLAYIDSRRLPAREPDRNAGACVVAGLTMAF